MEVRVDEVAHEDTTSVVEAGDQFLDRVRGRRSVGLDPSGLAAGDELLVPPIPGADAGSGEDGGQAAHVALSGAIGGNRQQVPL